jgi:hypothetical protein
MDINLKLGVVLVCVSMARQAVSSDAPQVFLRALRRALGHAGVSDKQVAIGAGLSASVTGRKLRGEKPVTFEFLNSLPVEAIQWFAVELSAAVGTPPQVESGARLRQIAKGELL